MDNAAALAVVNGRLKKGEGWIGYRYSKNAHGERVQSKSLYFSFYQNGKQKFILTKTNDPEQAYRDLLEARAQVRDGVRRLPVSKLHYEDLHQVLVDHYREHYPSAITTTDEDGKAHFAGSQHLDKFFRDMPILEITALTIKGFRRNIWNQVCAELGFGQYDKKTRKYNGLLMHDFRRSAARNLLKMGVRKELAKRSTGHLTGEMFDRYAIQMTEDLATELRKFKPAKVVQLTSPR